MFSLLMTLHPGMNKPSLREHLMYRLWPMRTWQSRGVHQIRRDGSHCSLQSRSGARLKPLNNKSIFRSIYVTCNKHWSSRMRLLGAKSYSQLPVAARLQYEGDVRPERSTVGPSQKPL